MTDTTMKIGTCARVLLNISLAALMALKSAERGAPLTGIELKCSLCPGSGNRD
jgi:hypothetical protein